MTRKAAKVPPTRAPRKRASAAPKSSFRIRKLALVVVVDELDAQGESVRLDIELGPFLYLNVGQCITALENELPAFLAEINERGTLQPPTAEG